jgi:hypothetical protein
MCGLGRRDLLACFTSTKVQILTQKLAEGRAGKADGGEEAARTAIK